METKDLDQKIIKLFVAGFLLTAIGFLLVEWLPLNKRVWSPSYALVTCGLAAMLQAALLYFIGAETLVPLLRSLWRKSALPLCTKRTDSRSA